MVYKMFSYIIATQVSLWKIGRFQVEPNGQIWADILGYRVLLYYENIVCAYIFPLKGYA